VFTSRLRGYKSSSKVTVEGVNTQLICKRELHNVMSQEVRYMVDLINFKSFKSLINLRLY
jgi:hypothetical protein